MIELENVTKEYPDFRLQDITLGLKENEYTVILGPSGSGKTLLLEIIAGLITPDRGKISNPCRDIGLIYQDFMLFPHLSVFGNIAYGLRIRKKDRPMIARRVRELCEQLDIVSLIDRGIAGLSGGEKQRVAIARAMAVSPELYLIDEPTSSLDHSLKYRARRIFMDLYRESRSTFIHVTHDFREALSVGDRLVIMMEGRIVQDGTPEEVFAHPGSRKVADFLGYRNVFRGKIADYRLSVGKAPVFQVPVRTAEVAYIAIRSDDIVLSPRRLESSARNNFPGVVRRIANGGLTSEVEVDIGVLLSVDITSQSRQEMGLRPGKRCWVSFKVSAIKVFGH